MSNYLRNLKIWLLGWGRFDQIAFKSGWGPKSPAWFALYAIDYGTRVLTGGACVSWSRWFFEYRARYRWAKFIDRILGHIDPQHGEHAGPPLWGTRDCDPRLQAVLVVMWCAILIGVLL